MVNSVISAVCSAIFDSFGSDYPIYKELVKQNLAQPCFFVECVIPKRTQHLNNRYYRQHSICIYYFPSSPDNRFESNSVLEKLYLALDFISIDANLVQGKNFRCEFVDPKNIRSEFSHSIMKFYVDFDFFTYENTTLVDLMGDLYFNY